ncbi:unnamed protein product [Mucor hiemalis]
MSDYLELVSNSSFNLYGNASNCENLSISNTGTVYYPADIEQETRQTSVASKRQSREELHDDPTNHFRRKQSRLGELDDTVKISPVNLPPRSPKESGSITPPLESNNFELTQPTWDNPLCWAFLQSLNPLYDNLYLKKKTSPKDARSGYLIGRDSSSDIVIDKKEISRSHCLIYMETGSNGRAKGIRIYLEDKSFNGTFVNGTKVGIGKRVLLKGGDEIQLYYRTGSQGKDSRYKFFRILFPPSFDANLCENVYNFNKELGRGNFATVYHAVHTETNEEVAIKMMQKSRFEHKPKFLKSVIQEMSIMMTLVKHPFIVQMKEIYNELSRIYFVLEYVRDGELFQYIKDSKKFTEDETRFIFWQLFHAIHFLHLSNIAHRDLKPENVIMADKKKLHVKVSDFGLAKTEERNQSFDSQCGTPNYVAPEVLNPVGDRAYDKQCDMWSLGVMLYICLCGYPPFSDENGPPSMKAQIKMGRFEFSSPYWDGVSSEAKDLVTKLLTVDPEERATIDEAMEHPWMNINSADLNERKSSLGAEALSAIDYHSINASPLPETQRILSQSHSL